MVRLMLAGVPRTELEQVLGLTNNQLEHVLRLAERLDLTGEDR